MNDRDLDRFWESPPAADGAAPRADLAAEIAGRLAADLKPVRPMRSGVFFAVAFLLILLAVGALGIWKGGGHAVSRMHPLTSFLTFAGIGLSAALTASALAGQMVPAGHKIVRSGLLLGGVLLGLAVIFAALFAYRYERHFWTYARICFTSGMVSAAIASAPAWLILRRGAILDPAACGALAGLFGGLAGLLVLETNCSDFNVAHVLLGHWAVTLVSALAGWLIGTIVSRRPLLRRA